MLQTLMFISTVIQLTDCYRFDPDEPTDFSILVTENFTGEAGLCIRVFCSFTVPQSVSEPIRRTWFKGDPQRPSVEVPCVHIFGDKGNKRECSFMLENLVQGESDGEYSFKLEWGQGKEYVFPQTVKITVKELTEKPTIEVPQLTAGEKAEISCRAPESCVNLKTDIVFKGIEPDEVRMVQSNTGWDNTLSVFTFHPEPEHHNTNLTCRVIFQENNIWTESTVILEVRHAPKILNSSRCLVWGDELTCMCVSRGVPLPQIYWPLFDSEYYSAFSAENTISIITVSIASFRNLNATIKCISENLIGWTEMKVQVHNHNEKPKESWSLATSWIFLILSAVVNIIFASCLTVILRRETQKHLNDDNHVYMTSLKREKSVYETIKISSERI